MTTEETKCDVVPKVYVVGFLFDPSLPFVLLHKKKSPEWQKDKLNGIGGVLSVDINPEAAMNRVFHMNTGLELYGVVWERFMTINRSEEASREDAHIIHFFHARSPIPLHKLKDTTDALKTSEFQVLNFKDFHMNPSYVPDLNWLIPMALYRNDCRYEATAITLPEDHVPLDITIGKFKSHIAKATAEGYRSGAGDVSSGKFMQDLLSDTSVYDALLANNKWKKHSNE